MIRKNTKAIKIGNRAIGGENPIAVQSMCNVPSMDIDGIIKQINELENNGCEIIRIAVPDMTSAKSISKIKEKISIPLVADIHFDYRLAIEAVASGADKIRINPGNIGDESKVKEVVKVCRQKNIPIRIGVNSGSLEKEILRKYGKPSAQALFESARFHISLLEKYDFYDIIVSIKSSDVYTTVNACRIFSESFNYPLHLGVTEAGTYNGGIIKSSIGIGSLLLDGIGDTVRVSLTDNPLLEVKAAYDILKYAGIRKKGAVLISCPTCGRTGIDLITLAKKVEERLTDINKDIKVAVMGCAVNGPGEAREADIGVAGGNGEGLIFKKGEIIRKVKEEDIITALFEEIEKI